MEQLRSMATHLIYFISLQKCEKCCSMTKPVRTIADITKFLWTLMTCHQQIFTCWYFEIQITMMPVLHEDKGKQNAL
jgi:hypothetical protein